VEKEVMEIKSGAVSCQSLQDDLALFATGGLTDVDRARVEAHRQDCRDCATEIEVLSAIVDALAFSGPDAVPPESLFGRIMAVIDPESSLVICRPARIVPPTP
jgi:anti-sigma factor ChrR (cupin superfamily)